MGPIVYTEDLVGNFRLLNFATGSYNCTCCICGENFIGDKRAAQCLSCALKAVDEIISPGIKTPFCGKMGCEWPRDSDEEIPSHQLKNGIAYLLNRYDEGDRHIDGGISVEEIFAELRQLLLNDPVSVCQTKDTCPDCGGWGVRQADGLVCSWCHGTGVQWREKIVH